MCYFQSLTVETEKFLKDGLLTEENVLEKVSKVINLLRDCNVTLRWVILHCTPSTAIGNELYELLFLHVLYDDIIILQMASRRLNNFEKLFYSKQSMTPRPL